MTPKVILQVLFDGEHIADLEQLELEYDHPFHLFRLIALTSDTDKLRDALDSIKFRGPRGETILRPETKEWYYPKSRFGSAMREDGTVSVRFFGAPVYAEYALPKTVEFHRSPVSF